MSRAFFLMFVLSGAGLSVSAQQVAPEPATLVPGQSVERAIARGESHIYQIALQAGHFMRVVVEQRGMDVALALGGPDGKPLVESDLTDIIGTPESLSYEAVAAGTYQLVVRANGAATRSGAYETRLDVKVSAGVQDRKRLTAESLLNETRRLYNRQLYNEARYADPQVGEKLGQALGLFRELEDRYLQGLALNQMGLAHAGNHQFDKAIEAYEQALSLWRGEKLRAGEATLLIYIGAATHRQSRYEKAIEYYEQALAIQRTELAGR